MLYSAVMADEFTLGSRLRLARERLDLTQDDIGAEFGIKGQSVSQWENDSKRPDIGKLSVLRRVLKVPYVWLLEGTTPPPAPNDPLAGIDDLYAGAKPSQSSAPAKLERRSSGKSR